MPIRLEPTGFRGARSPFVKTFTLRLTQVRINTLCGQPALIGSIAYPLSPALKAHRSQKPDWWHLNRLSPRTDRLLLIS